jgi:hypothetical protein
MKGWIKDLAQDRRSFAEATSGIGTHSGAD